MTDAVSQQEEISDPVKSWSANVPDILSGYPSLDKLTRGWSPEERMKEYVANYSAKFFLLDSFQLLFSHREKSLWFLKDLH